MSDSLSRAPMSPQRLARVTGLLYLVLFVFGMFSPLVLESVLVPGDAAATADNVLGSLGLFSASLVTWVVIVVVDIIVSVTFYVLLEPVSRLLSLVAAALRLAYSAVLGAILLHLYAGYLLLTDPQRAAGLDEPQVQAMALSALQLFSDGFVLALVLFGVHLFALGVLLYRSRYIPRLLSVLLMVAGVGYVVDSLAGFLVADYGGLATAVLLTPAILGELGLTVWLLVKRVDVRATPGTASA